MAESHGIQCLSGGRQTSRESVAIDLPAINLSKTLAQFAWSWHFRSVTVVYMLVVVELIDKIFKFIE